MNATPPCSVVCPYCGSARLRETHSGLFNRFKPDHGPFDFLRCVDCGSGTTRPVPTRDQLTALYSTFVDGMPGGLREIMEDRAASPWHERPVARLRQLAGLTPQSEFVWHDVGAGAGEMARLMATTFPRSRGLCTDLHERPQTLGPPIPSITWIKADLNDERFAENGAPRADVVYATGVWEHLQRPDLFVRNLLRLLKPHGLLYLVCPNVDCLAFKVMGRAWPYFSPGEHLHMPTPAGAARCIERQLSIEGRTLPAEIRSTPISIPYKLNYFLSYVVTRLGLPGKVTIFPDWLALPFPTGALETWLRL